MAVRDNRRGAYKDHKLYSGEICSKEFGADDNEGHDAMIWKNRERDWYNAERRFIFATKFPKRRNKWIEEVIKDKVRIGLRKGIAAVIGESKHRREVSHSPASGN